MLVQTIRNPTMDNADAGRPAACGGTGPNMPTIDIAIAIVAAPEAHQASQSLSWRRYQNTKDAMRSHDQHRDVRHEQGPDVQSMVGHSAASATLSSARAS